jgi:hypothetical protein
MKKTQNQHQFLRFCSHLKYFSTFLMLHILALDFEAKGHEMAPKTKIYFINVSYLLNLVKKCQNYVL